eukprot:gb/GECH01012034.1/.p1 GENE.gb/GECH01012034.1/~~gb/GECH01012034.1/.p1  ORF type:complete len:150 (+),score=11.01 gb/GECH01012034.1/:1-450(+)
MNHPEFGPPVSQPPNVVQDVPPKGGYPPIRLKSSSRPNWGFSMTGTILFTLGLMTWGHYRLWKLKKKQREIHREKIALRTAMSPFFQSEHDIMHTLEQRAVRKKIDKLMTEVDPEGWDPASAHQFYHHRHHYTSPRYFFRLEDFDDISL